MKSRTLITVTYSSGKEDAYLVKEPVSYIENCIKNIARGNEDFIILNYSKGGIFTLNPQHLASFDFAEEKDETVRAD